MQKKKIEANLIDDLVSAIRRNGEGYFTQDEIIEWLNRQKNIILEN